MTFIGAASKIFRTLGFKGFYQGVVPYLIADGVSGSIKFATFEISRKFVQQYIPEKLYGASQFFCAALSMLASSVTLVPGEVLKIRMQSGLIKNFVDGISQILQTGNNSES